MVRWGRRAVRGAAGDASGLLSLNDTPYRARTAVPARKASYTRSQPYTIVRQAMRFSLVVFTRPDLVWWQPFKPWCSWPQGAVLTCESPGCDVAWAAPRAHLARMGRQHLFRRDCPNARQTSYRVVFPSCCGAPERLLSYAVHVGRSSTSSGKHAQRLKGQALLRVPEGMFLPGMNSRHMNIMRSLHVCGMNTNSSIDFLTDVRAGRCSAAAPRGVGFLRLRPGQRSDRGIGSLGH